MAYSTNPNLPRARALALKLLLLQSLPPQTVAHKCGAVAAHIIARVLELRATLRRCAEVIWHYLHRDGVCVSLSSVRRILRRHHCFDGARKKRVRPDNPRRPIVTKPGELVQIDTIHYVCPLTKHRRYVYTVIDLHTRMAYAEVHGRIGPGIAARTILQAQALFGFSFALVQADNGPEFSRYFEHTSRHATVDSTDRTTMLTSNALTAQCKKNAWVTG